MAATILEEIAARTRERIELEKQQISLEEMKRQALELVGQENAVRKQTGDPAEMQTENPGEFPFASALRKPGISFICEVKKASPSKGLIAPDFSYVEIAKEYEAAGAAAMSVLTEPYYFQGKNEYLTEISKAVSIPLLRKDFTVDPYMIYQAKVIGASAVLLICALLTQEELEEYLNLAHNLGLSALVEAHDETEIQMALKAGAGIIGVNNRDLRTFTVDIHNSEKLRKLVPENIIFVSESGIKTAADVASLKANGTDAVLIGETFMRSPDKRKALQELRGE
ncbi:MAG: indole-3-glycerol phosphate synthase TrpC [Lachnospiraceae bacterium]|nr:indole-3-glycerol phosphate synthase TrpC [Lachnospiraceae bacterium]